MAVERFHINMNRVLAQTQLLGNLFFTVALKQVLQRLVLPPR